MRFHKLFVATVFAALVLEPGAATAFEGRAPRMEIVPPGAENLIGRSGIEPLTTVTPAPAAFVERNPGRWVQRLGGPTGGFRRIWGEGIPVDHAAVKDAKAALEVAEEFWRRNADLLPGGVDPDDLAPLANELHRGIRFVSHRQTIGGVEVEGTGVFVAIMAGRIALIGTRSYPVDHLPAVPLSYRAAVSGQAARQVAPSALAARGVEAWATPGSRLVVLPLAGHDTVAFRLVQRVGLETDRVGRWTAYVDAHEGHVLALRDERWLWDGTIDIRHHERHPESDLVRTPAQHLNVTTDVATAVTDELGVLTLDDQPSTIGARLRGPYFRVNNMSGMPIDLSHDLDGGVPDGVEIEWDGDAGEFDQAQLDAFYFGNAVREHVLSIADEPISWMNDTAVINVNHEMDMNGDNKPDYCNAWFDGEFNFLIAGNMGGGYDCNNTAMVGDIVYHEYGHGVHMYAIIPGVGSFDGAAGEGFADTLSSSLTRDHIVGKYFMKSGAEVRDLEPDLRWPDDQSQDPHQTGLIVGGAIWDLRKAFIEELGEEEGNALIDFLYMGAIKTTSDVPSVYESMLLADDDNGNLADGTPHFCTIYEEFERHGLASETLGRINIDHEPVMGAVAPLKGIALEADVSVGKEECTELGDVRLVYSEDDGESWTEVAMDGVGGESYAAELPGVEEGSEILYRIEVDEIVSGDVITRPDNPAEPYYKLYAGTLIEIFCDDFEKEDPGWTHELISGEPREGADDWMRDIPKGTGGDPGQAYSGDYCWGNDLTPEEIWDGRYQESKVNTLRSPTWDLSAYRTVRLQLRRWLTVEDGYFDQATIYVNEKKVWTNAVTTDGGYPDDHHLDREWILLDVDISEEAAGEEEVQVRFEISSDPQNQFGGWNIDDFCLYSTEEPVAVPDGGAGEEDGGNGGDADSDADEDTDAGADGGDDDEGSDGCGCSTAGGKRLSVLGMLFQILP